MSDQVRQDAAGEGDFDDPALRAALQRAIGRERAPEALRQRVLALAAGAAPAATSSRRPWWAPSMAWRVAAVLAVVLGAVAIVLYDRARPPIGDDTVLAMISTHDRCCAGHEDDAGGGAAAAAGAPGGARPHGDANGEWSAIAQRLATKLNNPVLAADLTRERWVFRGAALCPVGGQQSAHLVFTRGCQRLSVFSLRASACPDAKRGNCSKVVQGHLVAGFVDDRGVYCLVAHCPKGNLTLADVEGLLRSHERERVMPVAVADATPPRP